MDNTNHFRGSAIESLSRTGGTQVSASKAAMFVSGAPMSRSDVFDRQSAHTVQFYREDRSLVEALTQYIGTALTTGDAAVVIATGAHNAALLRELTANGFDIAKAVAEGRYQSFEASDVLLQIMADGMPDELKFTSLVRGIIDQAASAAKRDRPCVAVFGEMVALLWAEGKHEAAIRLEELWNALARTHSFSLRCAYPMSGFGERSHGASFTRICAEHSAVIPEESYTALFSDDERLRRVAELQQRLEALEKEKALHESERQLRLLVEAVQDFAIFMLDTGGRIRTWNMGAQRIKGYKAAEIIGKHFSCFYSEEDVRAGKPQRALEIAAREGRVENEGWRIRKDGSKFWANVVIAAVKDDAGNVIGFGKVTRDTTERMSAQRALEESQRKLQDSERSLRQLSFHLLRTQDEERRRIGRDLHDSLGQNLAVLKMKLDSLLTKSNGSQSNDAKDLRQCAQLTEDAVKEVRTISYLLYPPMLEEMGLKSAIPWYLEGFMKRSGIVTDFEVSPDFKRLPSDIELALFRVLQESLTNVHRHSGSHTADVRLFVNEGAVLLKVIDKGCGVNTQNFDQSGQDWIGALGVGLRGMSERMRQVGGSLEVSSTADGTIVTAMVPIPEAIEAEAKSS
jgi:PAS domain S-box-containing protein